MVKLDIVDYYNQVHANVSLADVRAIMLQQAQSYIQHYQKKNQDRMAILNS